jgi:pseudouridine 5'-phosphatase
MKNDTKQLRAVVFDLDGLMVNTEEMYIEVGHRLLEPWGHSYDDDLRHRMMGLPAMVALQLMIEHHSLDITLDDLAERSSTLVEEHISVRLESMPGLYELLDWLEANSFPKAIATSGTRTYARNIVEQLDIATHFHFILTAEDVTHGKPDPEIYRLAAARLELPPGEVMVLEDSENGCRAAVAAGTFAVAVPGDHNEGQTFDGVQFIADSLLDARIQQTLLGQ